jgi:hypothetical protein
VAFLVIPAVTFFFVDGELLSEFGKGDISGVDTLRDDKPTLIVGAENVNPEILKVKSSFESV